MMHWPFMKKCQKPEMQMEVLETLSTFSVQSL